MSVLLENSLKDDIDINRQVRSFYYAANKLKARFSKCSTFVKNVLFRSFCYDMYARQLWSSYYQYSLKRVYILRIIPLTEYFMAFHVGPVLVKHRL